MLTSTPAHVLFEGISLSTAPQIGKDLICVGIMAADPLRSIGLQSILEEMLHVRAVILPDEARPRSQKLHMLIVDQGFEQSAGFSIPLSRALLHMPGVAVVIIARNEAQAEFDQILAAGARAVLPDTAGVSEIRACVRAVLRGKTWTPREKANDVARENDPVPLSQRFTPKEREVMQWLSQGQSNREIANTMGIDEATVKAHLGRMLRKAEVSNRVELTLRSLAEQKGRLADTKYADFRQKAQIATVGNPPR